MNRPLADRAIFALIMLWGTTLFAALGVLQRGSFAALLLGLARPARALAVAAWIVLAALALGRLLLRRLGLEGTAGERWTLATLLGLGGVGLFWLLVGMVRLPPAWLSALLLALPLAVWPRFRNEPMPQLPPLPRAVQGFLLAMLALPLTQALAPPTSFDALLYHLRLPELWLSGGNVFPPQRAAHFFFPVLSEALYTPALQLGGEVTPQLLHWLYFPLALALLWQLTRRFVPSASAPLALVLAASIQMIPLLAGWAYTDLLLATYQVGALYALLRWREQQARPWLVVAALLAGMALGVKYLSFLLPLLAGLLILLVARRRALGPLVQFAVVAALVGSPSYLRSLIATDNPFFPFALPSPYWDSFRARWYAAAGTGIGWSLSSLLTLPWTATLGLHDLSYYDGRPGPLLVTFTPLAAWFWLRGQGTAAERHNVLLLAGAAGAFVAFWVLGVVASESLWQGRFLIPPLLLLCPVAAWGIAQLEGLATPRFAPQRLAHLFVGAWALFALLVAIGEWVQTDPLTPWVTPPPLTAWREARLGSYERLVQQSQRLPADARLLLLLEPRSYGMPFHTDADTLLYEFPWRLERAQNDLEALTATLCDEGYSHAAIFWAGARFLRAEPTAVSPSPAQYRLLEQWSAQQRPLWEDATGSHALLQLNCP